jgi:hypothetical protein
LVVQVATPVKATVAGDVGSTNPLGHVAVIVPPLARAPDAEAVKPTVHVELAPATVEAGTNVTVPAVVALAIVAVPRSTIAMTMAPAVNLFMR